MTEQEILNNHAEIMEMLAARMRSGNTHAFDDIEYRHITEDCWQSTHDLAPSFALDTIYRAKPTPTTKTITIEATLPIAICEMEGSEIYWIMGLTAVGGNYFKINRERGDEIVFDSREKAKEFISAIKKALSGNEL